MSSERNIQAVGIEQHLRDRISQLCSVVYNRTPISIQPFAKVLGIVSVTDTLTDGRAASDNAPNQCYFGTLSGSVGVDATNVDSVIVKRITRNLVNVRGEPNTGYAGMKYLPFCFTELLFDVCDCINATATLRTTAVFTGYVIHF